MSAVSDVSLQAEVLDRLEVAAGRMGPRLGGAWTRLSSRLRLNDRQPGYFLHPLAFPILQLPTWAAQRAGGALPEAAALAADSREAAAAGYLHVRVQDDWMDEGIEEGAATALLSDALLTRHQRLLVGVAGDRPAFWERFEAAWLRYAEAMLLERALHDGEATYDQAAFDVVMDRSRPLALPPAAIWIHSGLDALLPALDDYVSHLSTSHQLFTDLIDAERDLAAGNLTWVIRRMGISDEGAEDPEASLQQLRRALYLEGGFDAVMREARGRLEQAAEASRRMALPPASEAYLVRRGELMTTAQREVFQALFAGLHRS